MDNRKRLDNRGYDNSHVSSGMNSSSRSRSRYENTRRYGHTDRGDSTRTGTDRNNPHHRRHSWESRRTSSDSFGGREDRLRSESIDKRSRRNSDSLDRRDGRSYDDGYEYERHASNREPRFEKRRRFERDSENYRKDDILERKYRMHTDHGRNSSRYYDRDRNRDRDRDRDRSRDRDRGSDTYRLHQRQKKDYFPPPFESSSADYAFDTQTGYFYEERNDFFYDPKSKLYYSNERKAYYRYEEDRPEDSASDRRVEGKFEVFEESEGKKIMKIGNEPDTNEVDIGQDLIVQALQGDNKVAAIDNTKKISICIKQKSLGKGKKDKKVKKQSKNVTSSGEVRKQIIQPIMNKAHQENLEIWSQRGKEKMDIDEHVRNTLKEAMDGQTDAKSTCIRKIRKTKTGKPICTLCNRKFVNVSKFLEHEKKSKLHKSNVEKFSNSNQAKHHDERYIDRAHQRRSLYEADQHVAPLIDASQSITAPSLETARSVLETAVSKPADNLGERNIGNQILQKLMKKSDGRKDISKEMKEPNDRLKMEWERIESIAAINKRK